MGVAKKKCKNKRVYALRGGWTEIGTAKKSGVDALRGGWTITGIAKKVQNQEGVCIRGWVDND